MNKKQSTFFGSAASLTAALALTLLTITLVTFVLSSCSIPTGGEGNLTLVLPDGGKFVTYTKGGPEEDRGPRQEDLSQLTYIIHGSGPGILSKTVQGGVGAISVSVVPGNWTIWVEVKYGVMLYAESAPQSVNVTAGGSNVVPITIGPPGLAENTDDFGGGDPDVKYAYFSASDAPDALDIYLRTIQSVAGNYVIYVTGTGHQIAPTGTNPSFTLASGVNISLRGDGALVKSGDVAMWQIGGSAKLILRGPTLDGNGKGDPVVRISSGLFVMESGTITGTLTASAYGGGVQGGGGIFTMNGGSITDNSAASGGGVYVATGCTFTMNGGSITNNTANNGVDGGGGVFVWGGIFNLNPPAAKASISGNFFSGGSGAQVFVNGGTFKVDGVSDTSY
ncbi:hypothetical protein AGMMS50230_01130 [Spirochaetia bacterium]|nr:hypothetical protein AGMMS50230_01130 [Spirochaetia bacterium]